MLSRRRKRAILGAFFMILVVSVAVASIQSFFAGRAEQQRVLDLRASIQPRPPNLFRVVPQSVTRERRYSAQVIPWQESALAPEVSGRVTRVAIEVGQQVQAGDVLLELDSTLAELSLASAHALLKRAEASRLEQQRLLKEAEALLAEKVISPTEMESARARLALAEAEESRARSDWMRARENVARHRVTAPFAGTITERMVDVGDSLNINQVFARLANLEKLRVVFYVNEQDLASFQSGKKVRLELSGHPGRVWEPVLHAVSASADPVTLLFRIEGTLLNPERELPGNVRGVVCAEIQRISNALLVPTHAVRIEGRRAFVEVQDPSEGQFRQVEVTVDREIDGFFPVTSGLKTGDTVVIR